MNVLTFCDCPVGPRLFPSPVIGVFNSLRIWVPNSMTWLLSRPIDFCALRLLNGLALDQFRSRNGHLTLPGACYSTLQSIVSIAFRMGKRGVYIRLPPTRPKGTKMKRSGRAIYWLNLVVRPTGMFAYQVEHTVIVTAA